MNRVLRFRLWVVCVVLLLAVAPAAFVDRLRIGGLVAWWTLVVAIAGLILTTPPDAIRLQVGRSIGFIAAGTAWLLAWHVVAQDRRAEALAWGPAMMVAVIALSCGLARHGRTAWWAAVVAWHPLCVGPDAVPPAWSIAMLAPIAIASLAIPARRRRELTL